MTILARVLALPFVLIGEALGCLAEGFFWIADQILGDDEYFV